MADVAYRKFRNTHHMSQILSCFWQTLLFMFNILTITEKAQLTLHAMPNSSCATVSIKTLSILSNLTFSCILVSYVHTPLPAPLRSLDLFVYMTTRLDLDFWLINLNIFSNKKINQGVNSRITFRVENIYKD